MGEPQHSKNIPDSSMFYVRTVVKISCKSVLAFFGYVANRHKIPCKHKKGNFVSKGLSGTYQKCSRFFLIPCSTNIEHFIKKSVQVFSRNVANRQTNGQTNQQRWLHNIRHSAEVTKLHWWLVNISSGNSRQSASHYLNQRWPKSMLPYGITMAQCVDKNKLVNFVSKRPRLSTQTLSSKTYMNHLWKLYKWCLHL